MSENWYMVKNFKCVWLPYRDQGGTLVNSLALALLLGGKEQTVLGGKKGKFSVVGAERAKGREKWMRLERKKVIRDHNVVVEFWLLS